MSTYKNLEERIDKKTVIVGVIGLGYVGLPLVAAFHDAGLRALGFDSDPDKISALENGESYLKHLGELLVPELAKSVRFEATNDFERLTAADVILICVPTPLGEHFEPDLSYIQHTAQTVAAALHPGQLVILESTTYPGTTRDVVLPILETSGLQCGEDFFLAYSPEREDPGRKDQNTCDVPKLVGGIDEASQNLASNLYRIAFREVVPLRSAETAEAAKLLENIYRAVNIALVNELKILFDRMNIDVWEVIEAASTKPFGFQAFYPGPGLGGHCIPIDPFYLTWKAREVGLRTRFIELAGEINHRMPGYVVERCQLALNEAGIAMKGAQILVLGLAYKPDIDDTRESPSLVIIDMLAELGAKVTYHDPHVLTFPKTRRPHQHVSREELSQTTLARQDIVIVATHHSAYDWNFIAQHATRILDTRGVLRNIVAPKARIYTA